MRMSSSSKATALLLLVSLQYSFAIVDVALCSTALCSPKMVGAKYGKLNKKCPDGFELSEHLGKAACVKKTPGSCPPGLSLKDGKCCASATKKSCGPAPASGESCPDGTSLQKDCGHPLLGGSRKLMGNGIVDEINIKGHTYLPNIIMPQPGIAVNMPAPAPKEQPKINMPSFTVPQVILPEPRMVVNMPDIPKVAPEVKWEGSPSIIPKIVPIIPTSPITVTVPKDAVPTMPKINTDFTQKIVTVDLSKVGPASSMEVNLPAFPDVFHQATKLPDIDVKLPQMPKVLDFSDLGPKKEYEINLPAIKLPKASSITIRNDHADMPQVIDLSGLGPKFNKTYNVILPSIKHDGPEKSININIDDKNIPEKIVLPGVAGQHHTVVNVPAFPDHPEKSSSLSIDLASGTDLQATVDAIKAKLQAKFPGGEAGNKTVITIPDIDLSKKLPAGVDLVVDIKPLVSFNHSALEKLGAIVGHKMPDFGGKAGVEPEVVDIKIPDIVFPDKFNKSSIDIDIKALGGLNLTSLIPQHIHDKLANLSASMPEGEPTKTVINLPAKTLPSLPVPGGATDLDVTVPLKGLGLLNKHLNVSGGVPMVNVQYKEEWSGGNATLPNPKAKIINAIGSLANTITSAACPSKCCKDEEAASVCVDVPMTVEVKPVEVECEAGCSLNAAQQCVCDAGTVADCPSGLTKCSIAGKGYCVPDVEGHHGFDACAAFKLVCSKPGAGLFRSPQPARTMALSTKSACTSRVAAARPARAAVVVRASAQGRRELLGFGAAALLASLAAAAPAKADLTSDLLAKSSANKALNDKKRLATSSANVARSRTVADGTCSFPQNMFGCETSAARYTGGVKFIADDYALECEGSDAGKCASKVQVKF
ncbi:hypothetical protein HT031_006812 [Scenedesmus sp. PABB004]|nr:hypothetical protein HT031_006812 [Scenedesmus sp. PABB004]